MEIGGRWGWSCCGRRVCGGYFRLYCTHFRLYLFHQRCYGLDVRLQLLRNAHQWAQIVAQEAQLCQLKSYKLSISNFHSQQKWHIHMTLELPNLGTPKRPPRKVWESLHSRQKFVKKGQIMSSFILLLGNLSALLALKLRNFDGIFFMYFGPVCQRRS